MPILPPLRHGSAASTVKSLARRGATATCHFGSVLVKAERKFLSSVGNEQ